MEIEWNEYRRTLENNPVDLKFQNQEWEDQME